MKKKMLSLLLALALCLGLATPALALEIIWSGVGGTGGRWNASVTIADADETGLDLGSKGFQVRDWVYDEAAKTHTKGEARTFTPDRVYILPAGAKLVIETDEGYVPDTFMSCRAWSDPDGDGSYDSWLCRTEYVENEDGISVDTELLPADAVGPFTKFNEETADTYTEIFYSDEWNVSCGGYIYFYTMGYGGGIDGAAEISADYLIKTFGANTLFQLSFETGIKDDKATYDHYYFLLTDQPGTPAAPPVTVEDIPASGTAYASAHTVTVDGKEVEFQMYALKDAKGNLTNYIKLRDVAAILSGAKAQFEVGWNGSINLETGKPYTPNGSEMIKNFEGDQPYKKCTSPVNVNGAPADLEAITLTDAKGGEYNYFKLRDLGAALGFNVSWINGRVVIASNEPYSDAQ